ncbi:MAG: hypothetical protein A3H01_02465 [Candidatus Wildermuthbacteria bacterium RIFCSPLOWO2_12_FULL_40_9]|uniref:LiaF transmembrane domain-containing protein n=1 Tax=Candidatus Wildermuthbacteria bacterium RIFCSPLOWO2_12_FULL_40_9 TaxID=1802467 RepID=A0A1G2RWX5_9BACT|nr:MAG: hypothetical protein A3H01_02465 [Candidatus Wildermuthbacteria bacterium RIFCSPLOWO2_12_FULL_40_9]
MEDQSMHRHCDCKHHRFAYFPVLMIIFGLLFLGGALGWWDSGTVDVLWPVLVIAVGLFKWTGHKCKCC